MDSRIIREGIADVDQVVSENPETDPALDSLQTLIATTAQAVAPLEHTDAASHPVHHRCPFSYQRDRCSRFRSSLRVLRFGTAAYRTPIWWSSSSFCFE